MELTVEMMKKLLDSAIINNEDVERAQIETIKEALMNKYGIKAPKLTQRKNRKGYVCNIPGKYVIPGGPKRPQVSGSTQAECLKNFYNYIEKSVVGTYDKNMTLQDVCEEWLRKKKICTKWQKQTKRLLTTVSNLGRKYLGWKRISIRENQKHWYYGSY